MMPNLLMPFILIQLLCCQSPDDSSTLQNRSSITTEEERSGRAISYDKIGSIGPPPGYNRVRTGRGSFGEWLRNIPVKKDSRVFLYDGRLKSNQSAQFVVLDVPVGKKDLQQCADAVMRLRAEYLLDQNRPGEIVFADNSGKRYVYTESREELFQKYLERVFTYCGSLSLEKQLKSTVDFNSMEPGDVLIRGGSPGHAVIVVDMVVDGSGKKMYMLAQSYMPAQDIHILKNPMNQDVSPWYELKPNALIYTPEWLFKPSNLKKW